MRYLSLNSFNYNIIMARFLDPTYDPRQDSGTSGGDTSDLHPERAYDTDIRRLDDTARDSADAADTRNEIKQDRVKRYMAAAKTAGAYKQRTQIAEPTIRGRTPRSEAVIDGVQLPSLGDTVGTTGSTNYARKPSGFSGTFRGF
jgi:hypothetical protein